LETEKRQSPPALWALNLQFRCGGVCLAGIANNAVSALTGRPTQQAPGHVKNHIEKKFMQDNPDLCKDKIG